MRTADPSIIHRDRARAHGHSAVCSQFAPPIYSIGMDARPRWAIACRCRVRAREGCGRWAPAHGVRARSPRVTSLSPLARRTTEAAAGRPLNYAPRPVSSAYAYAALPLPWLQNRALCMHAALSQSQTQTRLNAALAPRPAWPSLSHALVAVAGIPLPAVGFCATGSAAARYLPLFIFLSRQGSTTSGRVSVAARLDARIDAPTSPARPAARVQCQASECSRDHQYMFGFCHCGHPPMTPLVARTT
jgi:hypothetical protein